MKKSMISWGLVFLLGLTTLFLWAYVANVNEKVQQFKDMNGISYFSSEFDALMRYENMLELLKQDTEAFETVITGGEDVYLIGATHLFPENMGEESIITINRYKGEMDVAMLSYIDSSSPEERQDFITDFEDAFTQYKDYFNKLAQESPYCDEEMGISGFCPTS